MARQPSRCSNVQNRSPWQVEVRNKPQCNQRFAFNRQADAQAYREWLTAQGIKAQLVQLETSFQLRLRRKGAKVQFITFDMLLRYAHLCCGNLAAKMDCVAMERTSKEYFHHGRRRRVDTVTSVVQVQPKP